jgi:hypothetical protein
LPIPHKTPSNVLQEEPLEYLMREKDSIHKNIIFESETDRLDPTRKLKSAPSNGTDHPILKVDFRRKIWNINCN